MGQLVIRVAETEEELEKVFNLRYRVLCEEIGFLNPDDYPDKKEKDEYDEYSINFMVIKNKEVIATSRITPSKHGVSFLMEKNTSIPSSSFCREKSVEFSRGLVLKEHRGKLIGIMIRGLDYLYEYCKEQDFSHIVTLANENMHNLYVKSGIPISYSGDAVNVNGFKSFPLIFTVEQYIYILRRQVSA